MVKYNFLKVNSRKKSTMFCGWNVRPRPRAKAAECDGERSGGRGLWRLPWRGEAWRAVEIRGKYQFYADDFRSFTTLSWDTSPIMSL